MGSIYAENTSYNQLLDTIPQSLKNIEALFTNKFQAKMINSFSDGQ